jgi:hypothetical protein
VRKQTPARPVRFRFEAQGAVPTTLLRDDRCQAIAKAETVRGNAARLGRSVHLCLCKTPGQDRLAALLLLVPSGRLRHAGRDTRLSRKGVARDEPCGFESGWLHQYLLASAGQRSKRGPFWLAGRPRCR